MAIKDIGPWLLENPAFTAQVEQLTASSVADDLGPTLTKDSRLADCVPDWQYLLLCASILAMSAASNCRAIALRIANSCLTDPGTSPERRDSAAVILDKLANHPTVTLALSRNLLSANLKERLPFPVRLEWSRRTIEDSISVGDRSLRVNHFQKAFWEAAQTNSWLSVSAPTSAGKSFIVAQWIATFLSSRDSGTVVYLVPTRALISQVERDMRGVIAREGIPSADVISTPVRRYIKVDRRSVLVFTQERLHILLAADPHFPVDLLIVDEAHKIGDRTRGVLLQQVIESLALDNKALKVIFASPASLNPEALVSDVAPAQTVASLINDDVMVSQNLIWASQQPRDPTKWRAQVCLNEKLVDLGTFELAASPVPTSKRLPFVAAAIGRDAYGNVIYVNGAADAEKAATQLYDLLGEIEPSAELKELIALSAEIIHPEFLLQKVLSRGIAFHYGNLPLILREEIERLFTSGTIRYLICTSTLVEGVNMACRNMFIRGPRRGKAHPMTAQDFWNLAGRAGRWGREFQGNIVCVDASDTQVWGDAGAPRAKAKYVISRATDSTLGDLDAFAAYVESGAPPESRSSTTKFEATFSYLCNLHAIHGSIAAGPWAPRYGASTVTRLNSLIADARTRIATPASVIRRNPGISPFAMDALLAYFRERTGPLEELVPALPGSSDAVDSYVSIFGRCGPTIAPSIGTYPKRQFSLALLVTHWMRGYQLSRLILERIRAAERRGDKIQTAQVIRSVMEDVEQVARFEAPRVMACYRDVLYVVLAERERFDLLSTYPDLSLLLEYGVAHETQISLITSGLSRTSTIALSEIIASDSLPKEAVLEWLVDNRALWRESALSPLVKREIDALLSDHSLN